MRPAASLQRRLLAAAAAGIVVALLLVGVLLVALFRHHVEQELAWRAQGQLDALVASLTVSATTQPRLQVDPARAPADPAFQQPQGGLYWLVQGEGGAWLRSRSWWDHSPAPALADRWPALASDTPTRLTAVGPAGQPLVLWARRVELPGERLPVLVAVGADTSRLQGLTRQFAGTVAAALAVLALLAWAAAWAQVRSGLAPLRRLHDNLRALRLGSTQRVEGEQPAELQPLVDDLNQLLADNSSLVEQARQQTGNLAHGLKTPLAVIGNASQAWAGPDAALVRQQLALMQRQVELHLARAQARSAVRLAGAAGTALAPVVQDLLRALRRLHADRGLQLAADDLPVDLQLRVPPAALQEMLGNLLDNACQWARQQVRVSVERPAGAGGPVLLCIDDDGPGIPAESVAQVLQRGVRLDQRRPGSGLGLAIVDELAQACGGQLALLPSPVLGGLRAGLRLPGH